MSEALAKMELQPFASEKDVDEALQFKLATLPQIPIARRQPVKPIPPLILCSFDEQRCYSTFHATSVAMPSLFFHCSCQGRPE
ncbi:hypothetical protein QR680_015061 [Steinernema hermaphroditum]|uniref:Uncharacterized protein n=1 Tax=Steinernema hermaphroditum TaxID=289476 RepID=A0AA39IB14_9BILA|nr:hypothetical protein QR680_015061 [Steinernema hermaphroditum]